MSECQVIDSRMNHRSVVVSRRGRALPVLLRACDLARGMGRDVWQLAVTIDELERAGISALQLHKLIRAGLVAHAVERNPLRTGLRKFQNVKGLNFTSNSCFVLTDRGEVHVRDYGQAEIEDGFATDRCCEDASRNAAAFTPSWCMASRILSLGNLVVKEFQRPAPHQELVLASFQELKWNRHIDDPIPRDKNMKPKVRLHDTIKKLNQRQLNPLVRFYGDGTGRGVCWELCWQTR